MSVPSIELINHVDLSSFEAHVHANAGVAIKTFLKNVNEVNYNILKSAVTSAVNSFSPAVGGANKLFIVTMPDGWPVLYLAPYRATGLYDKNTWLDFTNKTVAENLNTRPGAMSALLSNSGVAYVKYVFTTANNSYPEGMIKYCRVGENPNEPHGLLWSGMY